MRLIGRSPKLLRRAPHLIAGDKRVVRITGRILESLGNDRTGELLKLQGELQSLPVGIRGSALRFLEQQDIANKIEDRTRQALVAALGAGCCQIDDRAVALAHVPAL